MLNGAHQRFDREFGATRAWLFEAALPLWAGQGTDLVNGGFHERLNPDGSFTDDPRRTRLVARQIYVFSMASALGWTGPWEDRITHGLDFLLNRSMQADGRLAASVAADGTVIDDSFTLYDYAFALFALAAAKGALAKRATEMEERAVGLLSTLDTHHRSPDGRGYQDDPAVLKSNPHMHLLEAAIAWTRVSDDPRWSNMADRLADLCVGTFVDSGCDAVREYFDTSWKPLDTAGHVDIEPGHQFEWAWLLLDWAARGNRPELREPARRIFETGERKGVSAQGLVVNSLLPDHSVLDGRHRLWPQTERLKAKTALFKLADDAGRADALDEVSKALSAMRRYFDHPVEGAWWEHIESDGVPAREPSRASSLYHITCAVVEADSLRGMVETVSRATAEACAS